MHLFNASDFLINKRSKTKIYFIKFAAFSEQAIKFESYLENYNASR